MITFGEGAAPSKTRLWLRRTALATGLASSFTAGIAVDYLYQKLQYKPAYILAPPKMTDKVESVHDGDTLKMVSGLPVRLGEGVDALELKQPLGEEARVYLASLVEGKMIRIDCDAFSFNRALCRVTADGKNVGEEMVRAGFAFIDPEFDEGQYDAAAEQAVKEKAGACHTRGCGERPWKFRERQRELQKKEAATNKRKR